jgi:two-component system sensor histidine kinase HydH
LKDTVIDDVVARALRLANDELERRNIETESSTEGGLPLVRADPDLLSQVVFGLALNAAQALGETGNIVLRASADDDRVRVDVCDDGPGVPADLEGQIFEPFVTTKATGTGLGLPMAARIVQAHGGSLDLIPGAGAGGDGHGACFRITIPITGPHPGSGAGSLGPGSSSVMGVA